MSRHDEDVYRSRSRRAQRWKKAGVAVAGLAVIGSGAYFATDLYLAGRELTVAEPPALPRVTATRSAVPRRSATGSPSPFLVPPTRSAVRRQARPSPTPAPTQIPDDDLAAAQVNRLLQDPAPGVGAALADSPVTVARRAAGDGSQVRVVSARRDLTEPRYGLLFAGDLGRPVRSARCTSNLRAEPHQPVRNRSTMLLCWRSAPAKSVVTIAVAPPGRRPAAEASVALLDAEWDALG